MVNVRNAFHRGERVQTPPVSGVADVFDEVLLEDGTMGLKKVGEHDLNDFIQQPLDGTLVYNLLDRFAKTEDPSIFNRASGFYADITSMPTNLMEAQNMLLNIDKKFASLSSEIKEKFDNNSHKFAQAVLDGSIEKILGDFAQVEFGDPDVLVGDNKQKSEVKSDEQK